MKYKLSISPDAFIDTTNAYLFYENQQIGLGERFLIVLEDAYKKLSETPQHYGYLSNRNDLRDFKLKNFPFLIVFQIVKNQVLVLRVFNTNRNPRSLKNL